MCTPPRFTFFPYTTLFRSNVEVSIATIHGVVNGDIVAGQRIELGRAGKLNGNIQTPSLQIEQGGIFEGSCKMVQQDRKSTRLNSSHRTISYAVFCLKKKTK